MPRGVGQAGRFGSIIELGPRWARLLVALAELLVLLSTQLRNKWEGINSHRCPRDVAATAARARAADGRHGEPVECWRGQTSVKIHENVHVQLGCEELVLLVKVAL